MEEYRNVIRIGVKGRKYSRYNVLCSKSNDAVVGTKKVVTTKKVRKKKKRKVTGKTTRKKTLKQVLREAKALNEMYGLEDYMSIEVPDSKLPPRKYCDITGYEAKYTDPKSKLRYCSVEVMKLIRSLPTNIQQQYLSIRKGCCNDD